MEANPMMLTTQALIANGFAAAVTAVVVVFPNPETAKESLLSWFSDPQFVLTRELPDRGTPAYASQSVLVSERLESCSYALARYGSEAAPDCRDLVEELKHGSGFEERELRELLLLLSSQLCAVEWSAGRVVDPAACRQETLGLVDL